MRGSTGWWRQGLAEVADEYGGFYDSMHLPWHYTLVNSRLLSGSKDGSADRGPSAVEYDADMTVQVVSPIRLSAACVIT